MNIKTIEEIELMKKGGKILAEVLYEVLDHVRPGISELELDNLAERLILEKGGKPAFKRVDGYKHTICVSTNEVVVHGIPTNYLLKEGDVIGIDCGVFYEGFNTDMAETVKVQSSKFNPSISLGARVQSPDEIDKFLSAGKRALEEAINMAKAGNRIGHISKTIQDIVEGEKGYSIVFSLVGHGVGRELHEEPEVPGFLQGSIKKTPVLIEGMVIAIEVIYNMGKRDVVYSNKDGWTIKTKDNSLSGVFERTVAITKKGPFIITK